MRLTLAVFRRALGEPLKLRNVAVDYRGAAGN